MASSRSARNYLDKIGQDIIDNVPVTVKPAENRINAVAAEQKPVIALAEDDYNSPDHVRPTPE